jgi:DNA-binding LacI/PurR family transcriptional regulator
MNRSQPLYSQIQDYILEQIRTGKWPEHFKIPPERDLAEQFQVSRITAKNAILGLVAQGVLIRYRGKGTFVAGNRRQEPARPPSMPQEESPRKLIGFMLPWIEFHYANLLFAGIVGELEKAGYLIVFKRVMSEPDAESRALRELLDLGVDGLIVAAGKGEYFNGDLVRLVLNQFPVVMVEKYMRDLKSYGVYCDTEKAGYLMGRHLAEQKAEQIALISYPEHFTLGVKERIFGFQSAMVRHGIPPLPPEQILIVPESLLDGAHQLDVNFRCEPIMQFLKERPGLNAVATIDSWLAQLVCHALNELGKYDTVVVCCDEPHLSPSLKPYPQAYVSQDPYKMGVIAAQLILEAIEGKEPRHVLIEPELKTTPLFEPPKLHLT